MNNIPVSLQLWSVRDAVASDFRETVLAVAEMGYAGVELAGYGNLSAEGAATAVRESGITVSGLHVTIDRLRAEHPRVAEEAALLGTGTVICPWVSPADVATVEQCELFGAELSRLGAAFAERGLRFGYHNHGHEIDDVAGRSAFERILDATEPRHVAAELDVYWVHSRGKKPADFLKRLGGRVPWIHLKDGYDGGRQCEIGKGAVDFAAIFKTAEEIGVVEWYVVEQEEWDGASLESARQSLEQLRAWGKVK